VLNKPIKNVHGHVEMAHVILNKIMSKKEINLKESLVFLLKKTLDFFKFNFFFIMVANQWLIMVKINSY
jgi:hypothetical protein